MTTVYVVRIGSAKYLRLDGLKPHQVRLNLATRFNCHRVALGAADLSQAVSGQSCNVETICEP